jgi:1-phosphofructokinase family hexose kinase
MLLVVCPNLAIDRILQVEDFKAGEVQRGRSALIQPGGKGSNVARVFSQLGGEATLVGFAGRRDRRWMAQALGRSGVCVDAVEAFENSRTCTIVCDPHSGAHPTVINEESPQIEQGAMSRLLERAARWIPRARAVLTTGSLSMGLPDDFYAAIIDFARARGKITAIDATGAALRWGLSAAPTFMKPNMAELRELLKASPISPLAAHTALTFGRAGAALLTGDKCFYARPPQLFDVNPIGAGDAFVAGYLKSLLNGASASQCLRLGMAAAACDSSTLAPGHIHPLHVEGLSAKVEVRFTPATDDTKPRLT